MMVAADIVRAAMPGASAADADFVLWARTPFPMGATSAREIYRAARRWHRACKAGHQLCDWCDRIAGPSGWLCASCEQDLRGGREVIERHPQVGERGEPAEVTA